MQICSPGMSLCVTPPLTAALQNRHVSLRRLAVRFGPHVARAFITRRSTASSQQRVGYLNSRKSQSVDGDAAAIALATHTNGPSASGQWRIKAACHDESPAKINSAHTSLGVAGSNGPESLKNCAAIMDILDTIDCDSGSISCDTAAHAASRILALSKAGPKQAVADLLAASPAFTTLVNVLHEAAPTMRRKQLCNTVHALAGLSVPFSPEASEAYQARAKDLAHRLNALDVAMLLRGFAIADVQLHPDVLDTLASRAVVLLEEKQFKSQELSMLLYGCATGGYRNKPLEKCAVQAVLEQLSQLTPQGMANCVWALGVLGVYSQPVMEAAASRFSANPGAFKLKEACMLLSGMTALRFHPGAHFAAMVLYLGANAAAMQPADYACLFHALGLFGVSMGQDLLTQLSRSMVPKLPSFSALELCNCYWGLGLIEETQQPIMAHIGRLLPEKFSQGEMDEPLLRQAFLGLLATKMADMDLSHAQKEALRMGRAAGSVPPAVKFPPEMLDAMKQAWMGRTQAILVNEMHVAPVRRASDSSNIVRSDDTDGSDGSDGTDGSRSGGPLTERHAPHRGTHTPHGLRMSEKAEVAAIVQRLGVQHQLARRTHDGLLLIDIALNPQPDRHVALQIVAHHDQTSNTGQLLRTLQFQAQLLEVNGWEAAYLVVEDFLAVAPGARTALVADKLRSLGCRVPRSDGRVRAAAGSRHGEGGGSDAAEGDFGGGRSSRGREGRGSGMDLFIDSVQPQRGHGDRSRRTRSSAHNH